MTEPANWSEVAQELEKLYQAAARLAEIFEDRPFTLDGHLVGSIGEVIAAYMFDLKLHKPSALGHDAISRRDGKCVEIKLTQGSRVAIRHPPDHLIVLHRPRGGPVRVVYNGPGHKVWRKGWDDRESMPSNGQRQISLNALSTVDLTVDDTERLPMIRSAPV